MATVLDLPDDVLTHIFSLLNFEDRKSARSVCKQWHGASYAFRLIQNDVTILRSHNDLKITFLLPSQHVNVKITLNSVGDEVTIQSAIENCRRYWLYNGLNIRMLDLHICEQYLDVLPECLNLCTSLEHFSITLDSVSKITFKESYTDTPNFKLLKTLNVRGDPDILGEMLTNILLNAPLLQKFSYSCGVSSCKESHEALNFICRPMVQSLIEFYVHCENIDLNFFDKIVDTAGSEIERVTFRGANFSDLSFSCLRRNINLKHLFLQQCTFNKGGLSFSLLDFKQLAVVSLVGTTHLSSNLVTDLRDLPNLSHLDLSYCIMNYSWVMLEIFGGLANRRPYMVELQLAGAKDLTDDVIRTIAPNLPNLKVLNLNNCGRITSRTIDLLGYNNRLLQCLSIQRCSHVMESAFMRSINKLTELQHLDVRYIFPVFKDYIEKLNLPNLEALDWNSCPYDRYYSCATFVKRLRRQCPSLKYMNSVYMSEWASNDRQLMTSYVPFLKCSNSPLKSHYTLCP